MPIPAISAAGLVGTIGLRTASRAFGRGQPRASVGNRPLNRPQNAPRPGRGAPRGQPKVGYNPELAHDIAAAEEGLSTIQYGSDVSDADRDEAQRASETDWQERLEEGFQGLNKEVARNADQTKAAIEANKGLTIQQQQLWDITKQGIGVLKDQTKAGFAAAEQAGKLNANFLDTKYALEEVKISGFGLISSFIGGLLGSGADEFILKLVNGLDSLSPAAEKAGAALNKLLTPQWGENDDIYDWLFGPTLGPKIEEFLEGQGDPDDQPTPPKTPPTSPIIPGGPNPKPRDPFFLGPDVPTEPEAPNPNFGGGFGSFKLTPIDPNEANPRTRASARAYNIDAALQNQDDDTGLGVGDDYGGQGAARRNLLQITGVLGGNTQYDDAISRAAANARSQELRERELRRQGGDDHPNAGGTTVVVQVDGQNYRTEDSVKDAAVDGFRDGYFAVNQDRARRGFGL